MADGGCCEFCANYAYDEEDECYYCEVNLDEDEMYRFLSGSSVAARISRWMTSIRWYGSRYNTSR